MSFNDFQLVNLIRRVEQDAMQRNEPGSLSKEVVTNVEAVEAELRGLDRPFITIVRERAQQIGQLSGVSKLYEQFVRSTKSATLGIAFVMLVFGFIAALQALHQSHNQINIYWLLLLLLGFNTLSIILWLVFTVHSYFGRSGQPSQSPIISIFSWLMGWFSRRAKQSLFFANWSESNLLGRVGQWFSSKILHGVWIAYLIGGLLALFLALSGKQYDFVWGTTILSPKAFVSTTEKLSILPNALGFSVPEPAQIVASKTGYSSTEPNASLLLAPAKLRSTWAKFLIACILLYGILPRVLLWFFSSLNLSIARSRAAPDLEQAYFFQMRSRLLPEHASLGIIDPDQEATLALGAPRVNGLEASPNNNLSLPENALVAGFEWGDSTMPTLTFEQSQVIGSIDENIAQNDLFSRLKNDHLSVILLVPLERVVDRGAARLLKKLAHASALHLVVIRRFATQSDSARWAAWKMAAERINLPADQVQLYSLIAPNESPSPDE